MKILKISAIVILSLVVIALVFAKANRISPLSWGHNSVNTGMMDSKAINGYDAVAFYTKGQAIMGNEEHTYNWNNADWHFSSEANKEAFAANPEKYAPEYGGYCAFAVSKGFTANCSPESFEIVDDKLYFFSDNNVKAEWTKTRNENLHAADENWN